ncbi:MAG: hypothetical protein ACK4S4_15695 [Pyrinomonadaceae bacterium]
MRSQIVNSLDVEKFCAMLTLEGRGDDETDETRRAEVVLTDRGWTPQMIRFWRERRIPARMKSSA